MTQPAPAWSDLWRDVITYHPEVQWPVSDEVGLQLLGENWMELGSSYVTAGDSYLAGDEALDTAWPEGTGGDAYRKQVDTVRTTSVTDGEEMQTVGMLTTAFADDVREVKNAIDVLISQREEFYLELTQSLWAWFNGAEARRQAEQYRREAAYDIETIFVEKVTEIRERFG